MHQVIVIRKQGLKVKRDCWLCIWLQSPSQTTFAPENIPILPVLQLVGEHHLGEFGYSMAQQFDHDYLVVGAPASTLNTSVKQGGVVYVVHNISAISGVLCCSNVKIQTVGGAKPFERFGQRVQWIGLDADDSEDLVISAPLHSTNLNDFEKRELGAVSIYKNFRGSYSKSVFTSIDATTTFVGVIEVVDSGCRFYYCVTPPIVHFCVFLRRMQVKETLL